MKLQFSVAARNRQFSKAMRRIDGRFTQLIEAFQNVELDHPIHEAILVIITDDKEPTCLEEVQNRDRFFQVIAGCNPHGTDDALAEKVSNILHQTIRLCPFATPDKQKFDALFIKLRPSVSSS